LTPRVRPCTAVRCCAPGYVREKGEKEKSGKKKKKGRRSKEWGGARGRAWSGIDGLAKASGGQIVTAASLERKEGIKKKKKKRKKKEKGKTELKNSSPLLSTT